MTRSKALGALAIVFFVSGLWDILGAFFYTFQVGAGRTFDDPPIHPFYALFIASLFLCFAYLQIASAFNIRRYLIIVGVLVIGRLIYFVALFAYMLSSPGFPSTFWWTGIVDLTWSLLYIVLTLVSDEIRLRDLFLPKRAGS
jgi:hypothetical protein